MISADIIVLKKTTYGESSLILGALSPEYGRLDFVLRGAKRLGKKKFPEADLFRELHVQFRETGGSLHNLYAVDFLASYDAVALITENYTELMKLGAFILRNSQPMISSPKVYSALKAALKQCCGSCPAIPVIQLVRLVYLEEHGFLSKSAPKNSGKGHDEEKKIIDSLLDSAVSGSGYPEFSPCYWKKLVEWIESLCGYNELG